MNKQIDFQIMRRIQDGDMIAFKELVKKYKSKLMIAAYRIVKNRHDAEDVVQETFIRVYQHRDSFDFKHCFSTWIYTITNNLAIGVLRKKKFDLDEDAIDCPVYDLQHKGTVFPYDHNYKNKTLLASALCLTTEERDVISSLYGFDLTTGENCGSQTTLELKRQGIYWAKADKLKRSGLKKMKKNLEFLDTFFVKQ